MFNATAVFLLCAALSAGEGDDLRYSLSDASEEPTAEDLFVFQDVRPPAAPQMSTTATPSSRRATPSRNPYAQLARVPNMFGDSQSPPISLFMQSCDPNRPSTVVTQILTGGGSRYIPIGENNKPLPMDRMYFLFNGFNNVLTTTDVINNRTYDSDLQRYTFGFEKTFFEEQASLEIRFPLSSSLDMNLPNYSTSTGTVSNLTLVTKYLLSKTESTAIATGIGFGIPTGESFSGTSGLETFRLRNQALYLIPYIGLMHNFNENWFTTAYLQVEIGTNGDTFEVKNAGTLGKINAQTFGRLDLAVGRWLMRDMGYRFLDGIALVNEYHYVTSLNDGDVSLSNGQIGLCSVAVGATDNRVDYLNTTLGVHFQLTDLANLRVSGVFPMRTQPDRQFDSEVQVSFNRMF
jgi:hypothetical protein